MINKNVDFAKAYYEAMGNKDLGGIEKYLHPAVELISPLAHIHGKDAVLTASKGFMAIFDTLTIESACGEGDHVFLAITLDCPAPIGMFRTAVFLTFKEGLIVRSELFYDSLPLIAKRDEIFQKPS